MTIKIKKEEVVSVLFYITYVIIYLFSLEMFGMGDTNSRIRYYFLAISIIIGIVTLYYRNKRVIFNKKMYGRELLLSVFVSLTFLLFSIFQAKQVGIKLNIRTYIQISLILFPALYVFCIINSLSLKTIIKIMQVTLILFIIAYFSESGHSIFDFLNIYNWKAIDLLNSNSFTESNICSEAFLQLFIFFYYFKNMETDEKNKRILNLFSIVSFIFTILSFKRLGMLFAIILVLLSKIIDFRGKISSKFTFVFAIFFTVLTIFYTNFMQGNIFPSVDVYTLTTGRNYILSLWENKNYISYGYGSSMLIIGRYLEMDLVQIYLELGSACLFIFAYTVFKNAKEKIYSYLILFYTFFNMLTASSLPYSLGWIILLMTVTCISSKKVENEEIVINMKKQKLKKIFSIENNEHKD